MPVTFTVFVVSGCWIDLGTDGRAPRCSTAVAPRDGSVHSLIATKVTLDQIDVPEYMREILSPPRREVVEHAYALSPSQERVNQVGPDESRSSGDK